MPDSVPSLESLRLETANDVMTAARFAALMGKQHEIPDSHYSRGLPRWLQAIEEGVEAHVLRFASDAIEEVRGCGHPYADAIVSIIETISIYVETVQQTREPRYSIFGHQPFEARGGLTVGAAILDAKRAAMRSAR